MIIQVNAITAYVLLPVLIYLVLLSLFGRLALPPGFNCLGESNGTDHNNDTTVKQPLCSTGNGSIFGLYSIVLLGIYLGALVSFIRLPPLLGCLLSLFI